MFSRIRSGLGTLVGQDGDSVDFGVEGTKNVVVKVGASVDGGLVGA